jgi:hypothetical protein
MSHVAKILRALEKHGGPMTCRRRPRSATPSARAFWPILFHPGKKGSL